jgi:hypothetical protein
MILPENAEMVCHDAGGSIWYCADDVYYRIYPEAQSCTMIYGRYLPDPDFLFKQRENLLRKSGIVPDTSVIRPSDAVYALWEHRNKNLTHPSH